MPLFEPLSRRRVPTEAALLPVERARVALASLEDAGRTLEELPGLGPGRLRVGASTTPGVSMGPNGSASLPRAFRASRCTSNRDVLLPICAPGQEDLLILDSFLGQRFIAREEGVRPSVSQKAHI